MKEHHFVISCIFFSFVLAVCFKLSELVSQVLFSVSLINSSVLWASAYLFFYFGFWIGLTYLVLLLFAFAIRQFK